MKIMKLRAWPGRAQALATMADPTAPMLQTLPIPAATPAPTPPDAMPSRRYTLPVSGGHVLQVREWGREDGAAVLLLHGGPGTGCSPVLARPFDLAHWRVIAPDQRGAGESTPVGSTHANTLRDLLDDVQRLRTHLGLRSWVVAGGSWGATLALAHALDAPQAVTALLLRSVFLARAEDIDGFFEPPGAAALLPWQTLAQAVAMQPGQTLLQRLQAALRGADATAATQAALAWRAWEQHQAGAAPANLLPHGAAADGLAAQALVWRYRVQSHYLVHRCWLDAPPLLDRLHALPAVPTLLLHGTADRICPPEGARALHSRLPAAVPSTLQWAAEAGHDPTHPVMAAATAAALHHLAHTGRFVP